jgi:hypothetical protein
MSSLKVFWLNNNASSAHYLAENRHKSLDIEALKHPESQTLQLLENTYKWLGEISSGISISASADAPAGCK